MTAQAFLPRLPYSDITSAAASRSPMLSQLSALPPICHAEALARVRIAGKALRPANANGEGKANRKKWATVTDPQFSLLLPAV